MAKFGNMMASLSDEIHSSATRQRLMDQLGKMKAAVQPPVSQGDPIGSKTKVRKVRERERERERY